MDVSSDAWGFGKEDKSLWSEDHSDQRHSLQLVGKIKIQTTSDYPPGHIVNGGKRWAGRVLLRPLLYSVVPVKKEIKRRVAIAKSSMDSWNTWIKALSVYIWTQRYNHSRLDGATNKLQLRDVYKKKRPKQEIYIIDKWCLRIFLPCEQLHNQKYSITTGFLPLSEIRTTLHLACPSRWRKWDDNRRDFATEGLEKTSWSTWSVRSIFKETKPEESVYV